MIALGQVDPAEDRTVQGKQARPADNVPAGSSESGANGFREAGRAEPGVAGVDATQNLNGRHQVRGLRRPRQIERSTVSAEVHE